MFADIIIYILLFFISFFPIVIWAYAFSFTDENPLNKKRFLAGILAGVLSVIPILYIDKIMSVLKFEYLNVFYFVSKIKDLLSSLEFGLSLSLFLFLIIIFSFFLGGFFKNKTKIFSIYIKNTLVFLIFIIFLSLFLFLIGFLFSKFDFIIDNPINFGNIVFDTLKLIIFYYVIVAFIEEASKHFNFLQSSIFYIKNIKDGVLYAIFIALGFSFIENMLYLYNYYLSYGISTELLKLYFFRSSFSVMVHVLSSSIISYYFTRALMLYRGKDLSFPYLKIFSFGIFISVLLHLIFDVALTLGFVFIIFIYFIGGYLYVSSIFYKED
ncbi:MAG: PrsW family glutamic-type intramembrane protease [Candidatus Gracilibacteria bacterium]|nr:PrsW family glutamic-type intramembrane protease [Candidatus Gracilibacteria bacterium]